MQDFFFDLCALESLVRTKQSQCLMGFITIKRFTLSPINSDVMSHLFADMASYKMLMKLLQNLH